jgi:hypothetical protein
MAGNLTADNNGDILVEFDYNNIIVVDPNKTIDSAGKIQERLIDHESLVMYANLEADVLPRTKLAVGGSPEDRIKTISVAKMNFLKPTKDTFLGVGYYDELTGNDSTKFNGSNQMQQKTTSGGNGTQAYTFDTPDNLAGVFDNGLLGITSINVTTNSSFIPSVEIKLEDVQGKALFQLGENSPYAAFFNLPYPPFYLTLKGYYGQAIRYQLNLEKFHAAFNTYSGNYVISLTFKGFKFNVLNEVSMGHLLAVPHMYGQTFDITTTPGGVQESNKGAESQSKVEGVASKNNAQSQDAVVTQIMSEKGYQKIVEVYSEYKSKGLIPVDLPELSLYQLMNKLQTFENTVMASFPPAKVEPLTNVRNYKEVLKQYFENVRSGNSSWFVKYLDPKPIMLKGGKDKVYIFKANLDQGAKETAITQLKDYITKFNKALAENGTLGVGGPSPIPNPIKYNMIEIDVPNDGNIDWEETIRLQTGKVAPTADDIEQIKALIYQIKKPLFNEVELNGRTSRVTVKPNFFIFEGNGRYDKEMSSLETQANKKLSDYETSISAELLRKIEDKATGLGFKPTVRNMIAVVMASAEAFLRLLDDVHTNAWDVKYDPVRKNAILDNPSSAPSTESRQDVVISNSAQQSNTGLSNSKEPVYPWPQFFVESPDDKKGRFELKYIADPTVVDLTQGWNYAKWPEVEFVEEYMKGLTRKFNQPSSPPPLDSDKYTNVININAIEFPSTGAAYTNKEEIKFFYEIWERQFLTSHYSGLNRANQNQIDSLIKLNSETEVNNIVQSINVSSPYLSLKLKNYDITANSYPNFLKTISNSGTGRAYQDYIRDFFVTPYIKNLTENSYSIMNILDIGKIPQVSTKSDALLQLIKNASNEPLVVDTLPFTDSSWSLNNLSSSNKSIGFNVYDTKKTLKVFENRKIIANFNDVYDYTTNRPVTNFSYLDNSNPTNVLKNSTGVFGLGAFYTTRLPSNFTATEGYCEYITPTGELPFRTTTSILNTPYFVNSIQNGVQNTRTSDPYPYVQSAYLFLNSLPLASLRERYKTKNDTFVEELDYIASCFKKFGAIHKIPYAWVLKYGSVWYRYKKYKESNVDILSSAWKNFNYTTNYSPILSSITQTYDVKFDSVPLSITLQNETTTSVNMQIGFYPKVVNDFNVFYNGYELYSGYTSDEIQQSINGGMKIHNFQDSNITGAKQDTKDLTLQTYSVLLQDVDYGSDINCNPTNNTKGVDYFIVPSFGNSVNQINNACLDNFSTIQTTKVNVSSNNAVYNGSVRTLWSAPNYGYFDADQIKYPQPDSYLNFINSGETQSPMYLSNVDKYSKIEEVFSVFEKKILDSFEQEFLNFCKPITDIDSGTNPVGINESTVNGEAVYRNFQSLFKSLMTIPAQKSKETNIEYFNNAIGNQYEVFQNGITSFMNYDILFRYGNPSNYQRRVFDSYLSHNNTPRVTDPIKFLPYVQNTLPSKDSSLTLGQSKLLNPNAWIALETEVGFSTIRNVEYSSNGSYITDFFIDNNIEFSVNNVVLLAPIIKMYATQLLRNPNNTVAQFQNQIVQYLTNESVLQDNFLNLVLSGVRKALPNQQQLPEKTIQSAIDGQQSKVENYEVFKALNDKWIAGGDYKSKTLFEDMLFLDRASRNIGDTILLDIFDLKNMFSTNSLNQAMSVFTFVSGILIKNNFTVMNLPAYVNFYNVQDVDGTTIPNRTEGSLAMANSLWGTFLDVDYRKSSSKMVCFYVGKPSQYLALPKVSSRFRDDSFEMRRASENPLIENQSGKKDWAVSNKCVGFNVDIGTRNQGVFHSFNVSQDNGKATSESINTMVNMVDQSTGKNTSTQNVGLYNLYKQRSYTCQVVSLGNALLQPTMYFNLRHVPMFNGPYLIQQVDHAITPGQFQTTITGIRQGIYDLPAIDTFIQSINQNLLTKVEALLKIKKDTVNVLGATTDATKSNKIPQKSDTTKAATNTCSAKLLPSYASNYGFVATGATQSNITEKTFANELKRLIPNLPILQTIIYSLSYISSFQKYNNNKSGKFDGWDNNLAAITLDMDWGESSIAFLPKYSCVNVTSNPSTTESLPFANFASLESYIIFMRDRLIQRIGQISEIGLLKYYVCYWPKDNKLSTYFDTHLDEYKQLGLTVDASLKSALTVGVATKAIVDDLKNTITESKKNGKSSPNATPTPVGATPLPGQTCPPPVISSFSPLSGNTGTIVQVNGYNLNGLSSVVVNGVTVLPSGVTVFDDSTLRFVTPEIGTGKVVSKGDIVVTTNYGSATSSGKYTFDPSIVASEASSPGGFQNPENQTTNAVPANNANTNPQTTGPITLIETENVKGPNGSTTLLTVKVNPEAGAWKIDPQPDVDFILVNIEPGPNNKYVEDVFSSGKGDRIVGFVSPDQQVFSITESQMINEFTLKDYDEDNVRGYFTISLYARPVDRVANPKDVILSYKFNVYLTDKKAGDPVSAAEIKTPPGTLTKVSETSSGELPNFNGVDYYNIKKPAGGYITYQFTCEKLISKSSPEVYSTPGSAKQNITITNNSGTKYTNVIEVSNLGVFQLQVGYTSESTRGTATSPNFTL